MDITVCNEHNLKYRYDICSILFVLGNQKYVYFIQLHYVQIIIMGISIPRVVVFIMQLTLSKFNDCTGGVKERMNNFVAYFTGHVVTYPCRD